MLAASRVWRKGTREKKKDLNCKWLMKLQSHINSVKLLFLTLWHMPVCVCVRVSGSSYWHIPFIYIWQHSVSLQDFSRSFQELLFTLCSCFIWSVNQYSIHDVAYLCLIYSFIGPIAKVTQRVLDILQAHEEKHWRYKKNKQKTDSEENTDKHWSIWLSIFHSSFFFKFLDR